MKNLTQILFFLFLYTIVSFPQDRNLIEDKLKTTDKLFKINNGDFESLFETAKQFPQFNSPLNSNSNTVQSSSEFLISEAIYQYWWQNSWRNGSRTNYFYSRNNILVEKRNQTMNINTWNEPDRVLYFYDEKFNLIETISKTGDDTSAVIINNAKYLYKYDLANRLVSQTVFTWEQGAWEELRKTSFIYNLNDHQVEQIVENWNSSAWENSSKETYKYENRNLVEHLSQDWDSTGWENRSRSLFSYDENKNQIQGLYQYWDHGILKNGLRALNRFDQQNRITELLLQDWRDSTWVNYKKELSAYFQDDKLSEFSIQYWKNSDWSDSIRYVYTYDTNNNLEEELWQRQDNSSWEDESKITYSYIQKTSVNILPESSYLSNNFPNPFNPFTNIQYTISAPINIEGNYVSPYEKSTMVSLKIYDMLGKEIATLVDEEKPFGTFVVRFNGGKLASGIYFCQLRAGSFIDIKKMMLIK